MPTEQDAAEYWDEQAKRSFHRNHLYYNWNKLRMLLKRLLDYNFTEASILEIGCGLAIGSFVIKFLHAYKLKYRGTDVSSLYCEYARTLFKAKTTQARANKLPFDDNEFDVIWAFDSLEHIPLDEREDSYREIDRVLNKNGLMFINYPTQETLHDRNYDYDFGEADIQKLQSITGMRVIREDHFGQLYGGSENTCYVFMVLER